MMTTKTSPLALCAFVILLFASCTEAFKHKMEVADKYIGDMSATRVYCGTSTETSNGVNISMTTLTFQGCDSHVGDIEREWAANAVAKSFLGEMTDKDLEGETHLKIAVETLGNSKFEYVFDLNELRKVEDYLKITDEALAACMANDQEAINKMKDDEMMPDDVMYQIYDVTTYNDSVFSGQKLNTETLGYRFAEGAEDPSLKLFSVDYDVIGENAHTRYTINIDLKTKKLVYIWLKTSDN